MAVKAKTETTVLFKASHRYARISARKARLVMDLIRGQRAEKALVRLTYCERRASPMIRKVLKSAIANAAQMSGVESGNLVVEKASVDEGPTMKRWRPRSMGRAFPRLKRSCHLNVELAAVEAEATARAAETEETITEDVAAEEVAVEETAVEEAATGEAVADEPADGGAAADDSQDGEDAAQKDAAAADDAPEEVAPVDEDAADENSDAGTDEEEPAPEGDPDEEESAEEGDGDK